MKRKGWAVLAMAVLIGAGSFPGGVRTAYAEENVAGNAADMTPYIAYLEAKEDVAVRVLPGTSWTALGMLEKGQPAIAAGKTGNGWTQIYYTGMIGYIPGDSAAAYVPPEPTDWKKLDLEGNEIRMNALGDSITYGDKLSSQSQTYVSLLGEKMQAASVNNYGFNGSNIAGIHPDRFVDRYVMMDRQANLVLVFGGTNDYGGYFTEGTQLGQMGDVSPDTFYGGLNMLMCGLKQMYPDGEIVFITPLKRRGYMRKNQFGYSLADYVEAIRRMGAFYGIRVLDAFSEPELDFSSKQAIYLSDGLHPNEKGQALISAFVYRKLFEA